MTPLNDLATATAVDLDAAADLLPPLAATRGIAQDPRFHAEGDVFVHTGLVVRNLEADTTYRTAGPARRQRLLLAALLHDVGKASTTRHNPDGTISSHGHARRGAQDARALLYRLGVDPLTREAVAGLVAAHMRPYRLLERETPEVLADQMSWEIDLDDLAVLARADARGRQTRDPADRADGIDRIELFEALIDERGLRGRPQRYADAGARMAYLARAGGYPRELPTQPPGGSRVLVMSGLPGSGKDSWLAATHPDLPVVSLDELRGELGVSPTNADGQGKVIQTARERARQHLRAGRAFAWNATNLSRDLRGRVLELARAYDAHIEIVHVEAPWAELLRRNRTRDAPLPEAAFTRLLRRWEPAQEHEAHVLTRVIG